MEGYFDDSSMIRRVHRERAVALSGPRALLMQAAHPLAISGLLAHSGSLEDPYERLERTAEVMSAITFGPRDEADRITSQVRAMHGRVRGRISHEVGPYQAGTPYRADDPELLMWVLYTLVDSAIVFYELYVGSLSEQSKAAFWEDYRVVGRLFGLAETEMPASLAELRAYGRDMLAGDGLHVSEWARTRARQIVFDPPIPVALRPLVETVNFITIALLPPTIRDQYGFARLPPAWMRGTAVKLGAEYVKRAVLPLLPSRLRLVPPARAA